VVVTALYDPNGLLRGFAKVTQDLTQRRQSEQLEKSASNLKNFIAILAHELRNPLAPIRNAVELQKLLPLADPRQQTWRDVIDRQSGQLSRMVDDLLDISRVTRARCRSTRSRYSRRQFWSARWKRPGRPSTRRTIRSMWRCLPNPSKSWWTKSG
jgi:signal transduction histidine kinase